MPIANCIVTANCKPELATQDLISVWSEHAGISEQHMTVNLISSTQQLGNPYDVMATLQLPSMWSKENVSKIQTSLTQALASYFGLSINQVHVITQIIQSGMVVENGEELSW